MNKIITILAIGVLVTMSTPTIVKASNDEGQKIFKKKFRKQCGFSGVRFARYHTQGEWEEIYDEGKFPSEAKRICPRLKINKIKPLWWEKIYDFSYSYAKDGKIPKC